MGPRNRTPWNLIHKQHSSPINGQTWHHVLKKSRLQINDINRLQAPSPRLLFNSGHKTVLGSLNRATDTIERVEAAGSAAWRVI